MLSCSHCFAENPREARFCMHCGHALAAPGAEPAKSASPRPLQGENRVVTVLFADIAGSTRLAEVLGAEAWHQLLGQFFTAVSAVIERAGGVINQYTGDGVMALFGAPHALENHALSACAAALEAQQRIERLADTVRLERGLNFGVRMGLNSGAAVVGSIADGTRQDYTAQGATVHIAARMENLAQPGSVYLTWNTATLVEDYCDLRAIGEMPVKGVDETVRVFELRGINSGLQRLDRSRRRGLSPFVGRLNERAVLERAYQSAVVAREGGQLVVVEGDAGLGKSRLCAEMLEAWRAQGKGPAAVLQCAPVSQGEAQPMAPLRAMLAGWLGVVPGTPLSEARRIVAGAVMLEHPQLQEVLPALLEFLQIGDSARNQPLTPEAVERQQKSLPALFCRSFSGRSVVLWVDDWHWIDEATREHLALWIPELLQHSDALVLITTRPTVMPDWVQSSPGSAIRLRPITDDDMLQLAAALVGEWVTTHPLGARLARYAEGNPYFIEEAVAHLVDSGVLAGSRGMRKLVAEATIALPRTVQSLLAARIDRLTAPAREVLECAALIGRDFCLSWLAATVGREGAVLQEQVEELLDGGFLEPLDEGEQWRITHGLLLEEARRRQLETVSRARYARLAAWLSPAIEQGQVPLEQLPRLGVFWERAGDNLAAARANLAAMQNMGRFGVAEGMRLGRLAKEQAERENTSPERDQLLFQIHAGLLRGSTFAEVPHTEHQLWIESSESYLARNEDPYAQVEFWMSTATHALNHGDARRAFKQVRSAMLLARELGSTDLLERFRVPILLAHLARGAVRRGLTVLDADDQGAWRQGPPQRDTYTSRGFYSLLLASAGQVDEAIAELERVIRFSEDAAVPVSWMYSNLAEMRLAKGQRDGLDALARRATEVAREFGSPTFDELATRSLALVLAYNGEPRQALTMLREWTPHTAPGKPGELFASAHAVALSVIADAGGDQDAALSDAERGVHIAMKNGQLYWLVRALAARLRLRECRRDRARLRRLMAATGVRFVPELRRAASPTAS